MTEAIIIAVLGSGALSTFITCIFQIVQNRKSRWKKIEDELESIDKRLKQAEKDALRTQLIMMIADYPDETTDILRLAQHYFSDLRGNWTATNIFNHWLVSRDIASPSWFMNREETK